MALSPFAMAGKRAAQVLTPGRLTPSEPRLVRPWHIEHELAARRLSATTRDALEESYLPLSELGGFRRIVGDPLLCVVGVHSLASKVCAVCFLASELERAAGRCVFLLGLLAQRARVDEGCSLGRRDA